MSRTDHSKEMQKFRDEFTIDKHMHMEDEDNAISSFQHKVEMMADAFRKMKFNCF